MSELDVVAKTHWYPPVREEAMKARAAIAGKTAVETSIPHREFGFEFFRYALAGDNEQPRASSIPAFVHSKDELDASELARYAFETTYDAYASESATSTRVRVVPAVGLRLPRGVLLGTDRGEWGGELVYVDSSGTLRIARRENVHGIHRVGNRTVAVVGLAHGISDEGRLEEIELRPDGTVQTRLWRILPGAPDESGVLRDGSLFVRCSEADVVVQPDGTMHLSP